MVGEVSISLLDNLKDLVLNYLFFHSSYAPTDPNILSYLKYNI